jgi:hypothetical protein
MKKLVFIFVCLCCLHVVSAGYGDATSSFPTWQERASHALVNAVRTGIDFQITTLNKKDHKRMLHVTLHHLLPACRAY